METITQNQAQIPQAQTNKLEPKQLVYKGKEYKLKPYSIEMGMAYDLYIDPLRVAYEKNFTGIIDTEYLDKFNSRIDDIKDVLSSFEDELTEEQQADKARFESQLKTVEDELLADGYAQSIIEQVNDIHSRALTHAVTNKAMMKMFFAAALDGDISAIEYTGSEYYSFALGVLTNFFLAKTAMAKSALS